MTLLLLLKSRKVQRSILIPLSLILTWAILYYFFIKPPPSVRTRKYRLSRWPSDPTSMTSSSYRDSSSDNYYQVKRTVSIKEAAERISEAESMANPFVSKTKNEDKPEDPWTVESLLEKLRYWRMLFELFDGPDDFSLRRHFYNGGGNEIRLSNLADRYEKLYRRYQNVDKNLFGWSRSFFPSIREMYEEAYLDGAGIVLCVCDRYKDLAIMLIRSIRKVLKSPMPIEIFYAGDGDLSSQSRAALEASGENVKCRDLLNLLDNDVTVVQGWAIKPFAVLMSSFERVLFMDADVVLLQSPEIFFRPGSGYEKTGTLFFHDRSLFRSG